MKVWNLVESAKFWWNCEIWLQLWNLVGIVKFSWVGRSGRFGLLWCGGFWIQNHESINQWLTKAGIHRSARAAKNTLFQNQLSSSLKLNCKTWFYVKEISNSPTHQIACIEKQPTDQAVQWKQCGFANVVFSNLIITHSCSFLVHNRIYCHQWDKMHDTRS